MPPSHASASGRRWEHLVAGLALLIATASFFAPAIWGDRAFTTVTGHMNAVYPWAATPTGYDDPIQSDQADLSYPWQVMLSAALDENTLPLWDLYSYGGGYPLYSNGSSGQVYPPRLLLAAIAEPAAAHLWYSFFHVFLGGLTMYFLCRRLCLGLVASLLGASSWAFGAFNLAWLHLEVVSPIILAVPLGVLAIHWAVGRRTWVAHLAAGGVLGLFLISGHVLWMGVSVAVALGYGTALAFKNSLAAMRRRSGWRDLSRPVLQLAATATFALTSVAVVLLPTLVNLGSSARTPLSYDELATNQVATAETFLQLLAPPEPPLDSTDIQGLTFVGTLAALFAATGLFTRRPGSGLGRVLAVGLVLAAVGTPITWLIFHIVPGMDVFRPYSRLAGWFAFGVTLLAAAGADCIVEEYRQQQPHSGVLMRFLAGTIAAGLLLLGTFQLLNYGRVINPPFPEESAGVEYPVTPLIGAILAESNSRWPLRILPLRRLEAGDEETAWYPPILFAAEAAVFGIDSGSGYDSTLPQATANLVRVTTGEAVDSVLSEKLPAAYVPSFWSSTVRYELLARLGYSLLVTPPSLPSEGSWGNELLDQLSLDLLYTGPDGSVYRIAGASNDPYLVSLIEFVEDDAAALRLFTTSEHEWKQVVILTLDQMKTISQWDFDKSATGEVLDVWRTFNQARMTVEASAPMLAVIPVNWDPGWTAKVDGQAVPVLRGNYNQQVIPVPSGRSEVTLVYRPQGMVLGAWLSAGSWLALLALWKLSPTSSRAKSGLFRRRSDRDRLERAREESGSQRAAGGN